MSKHTVKFSDINLNDIVELPNIHSIEPMHVVKKSIEYPFDDIVVYRLAIQCESWRTPEWVSFDSANALIVRVSNEVSSDTP